MNCTIRVVKTKALISFAFTAKLICAFVFTYADCWFSHVAAHLFYIKKAHEIYLSYGFLFKYVGVVVICDNESR